MLVDSKTLKECGIKDGTRILMIGSKINDILAVSSTSKEVSKETPKEVPSSKEPWCEQKVSRLA